MTGKLSYLAACVHYITEWLDQPVDWVMIEHTASQPPWLAN